MNQCRACPAEVLWCEMANTGKPNPLDTATIPIEEVLAGKRGVTAYNPNTRRGMSVTKTNVDQVVKWALAGATFHLSHFATCPARQQFKKEK